MSNLIKEVTELFQQQFGYEPKNIARAPGRVNLIGEHTDYNEGFVFPIAINRAVWIAFSPNQSSTVNIVAGNFEQGIEHFKLTELRPTEQGWLEYVKGIANELQYEFGDLSGFDAAIISDVPIGAGLSSSAALELAVARVFAAVNQLEWNAVAMAKLAQRAENRWVGVNCGIMDQLISATGEQDHAILIDCRDLSHESVNLPDSCSVVMMDTATRRGLVTSAYNERRQQCEAAAQAAQQTSLRDVSFEQLERLSLEPTIYRRAKHIISENERTIAAKQAMLANDPVKLGQLFKQSHASLRDDFEVTNDALNCIVDIASAQSACYGARMTGAGFGGCAVALVKREQVTEFCATVSQAYQEQMRVQPHIFAVRAEQGAVII